MNRILIATGTKREAAVLLQGGLIIIPGGGDATELLTKLREAPDVQGIVSFGMAGALVDDLKIGNWVIGDRVTGAVKARCDPDWSAALAARLPGARVGGVYADGRMVAGVSEKLSLGAQDACLAVDMESHIAARVAAERDLPFAVVRCISDEAHRALPPAIAVAMRPDGAVDGGAILGSLLRQPGQLLDLMRTIAGFARAMRALKRGARLIEFRTR